MHGQRDIVQESCRQTNNHAIFVNGAYVGGYVKPFIHKENRRSRRPAINQNGKRQVVVIMRERDGNRSRLS
jgi:hypothetical protein